jgi:hypothetical protein
MPNQYPYYPRINKETTVLFGKPIYLDKLVSELKQQNLKHEEMRKIVTDTIQNEFYKLREEATFLHQKNYQKKEK